MKIPTKLQKPYEVIDSEYYFSGILLSPYKKKNKDGNYLCCHGCHISFNQKQKVQSPPKFAITNMFAIESISENIVGTVYNILSILIAPI